MPGLPAQLVLQLAGGTDGGGVAPGLLQPGVPGAKQVYTQVPLTHSAATQSPAVHVLLEGGLHGLPGPHA